MILLLERDTMPSAFYLKHPQGFVLFVGKTNEVHFCTHPHDATRFESRVEAAVAARNSPVSQRLDYVEVVEVVCS